MSSISINVSNSCKDHISSLPIVLTTMDFLQPEEVGRAERVSKAWHRIIANSQVLWRNQCVFQGVKILNPALLILENHDSDQVFEDDDSDEAKPLKFDGSILSLIAAYDPVPNTPYKLISGQTFASYYKNHFVNPKPISAIGKREWIKHGRVISGVRLLMHKMTSQLRILVGY